MHDCEPGTHIGFPRQSGAHDAPMKGSCPAMLVVILFATVLFIPSSVEAQDYSGPRCLGPACIDREMPIEGLAEQLG